VTANKRLTDLNGYKTILPYAGELFGVYQPMIGWRSKRASAGLDHAVQSNAQSLIDRFTPYFRNKSPIGVNADCAVGAEHLGPADFGTPMLSPQQSQILKELQNLLAANACFPVADTDWPKWINVPETEINDDNKVLATPIEKVYEHGFYPLQGGFRIGLTSAGADPNNQDPNFQIFDQWIEVLPTDQVVPVEVSYEPKTGRQL
jgi:hypothetical protein